MPTVPGTPEQSDASQPTVDTAPEPAANQAPQAPESSPEAGASNPSPETPLNKPVVQSKPVAAPFDLSKSALYDTSQTSKVAIGGMEDKTPDQAAKIVQLAARMNVAPSVVQDDPDGIQKQIDSASFSPQHFVQTYPKLADWVAENPMRLPMVKDDLPNIKATQDSIDDYSGLLTAYSRIHAINNFFHSQFLKQAGENLAENTLSNVASLVRIPNFVYNATAGIAPNLLNAMSGVGDENTKSEQGPTSNSIADSLENLSKQFDDPNSDIHLKIGEQIQKGNYSAAGRAAFQSIVGMAPMTAAMIMGGAPAVTSFALGAGADTMNRSENKEASPTASVEDALIHAGMMEVSGRVSSEVFSRWEASLTKQCGTSASTAIMNGLKGAVDYGKTVAAGYSTGWLMSASNDVADVSTGVNPDAAVGFSGRANESGLGMGLFEGAVGSVGHLKAINDAADIRRAQLEKDFLADLGNKIDQQKLKVRAPDQNEQVIDSITKDTPAESVHVSAEAFEAHFQKQGDDEVAKKVSDLGLQKEFDAAKEAGGTIEIPTSKWFSDSFKPEDREALSNDLTLDPSKPTMNEALQEHEFKSSQPEVNSDDSGFKIYQHFKQQYVEAGHTPAISHDFAQQNASFVKTLADNEGKTSAQVLKENPISIKKASVDELPQKNVQLPDELDQDINRLRKKNGIPSEKTAYGKSLVEFLKSMGGVSKEAQGQDIRDIGIKGLTRSGDMESDRAVELAQESGYLLPHEGINELLEKLRSEAAGSKQYSPENRNEGQAEDRERLIELNNKIGRSAATLEHSNEDIKKALDDQENDRDVSFQKGKEVVRGWMIHDAVKGAEIALTKDQNLSTALHESMHWYLHVLNHVAENGGSQRTIEIRDAMVKFAGEDDFKSLIKNVNGKGHELISQAFEKYLAEGKAPNAELKSAFTSFKNWMIQVYGGIREMMPNIKLNPEIRLAFDRMLSTDADIRRAKDAVALKDLFEGKPDYVSDEDWEKYQKAKKNREEASDAYMTAQVMKPLIKGATDARKAERDSVERSVTEDVKNRPEYKLLDLIKTGILPGTDQVENLKLNRKEVVKMVGEDVAKQLPPGVFDKEGVHADVLASMVSDSMNGRDLIQILANVRPEKEVIQSETDKEMQDRYYQDDPLLNGSIQDAAQKAIHSGDYASQVMAFELQWMKEKQKGTYNSMTKDINRRLLTASALRDQAQAITNGLSTRDLKPYIYQRAEAKHGNEALHNFIKGNMDAAFASRYHELLNHEIYKSVSAASDFVEKSIEDFKEFNGVDKDLAKKSDMDIINAGRVVLDKFGIGTMAKGDDAKAYIDKLKMYGDSDQTITAMNLIDSAIENAKHYGDLTYDKFVGLSQTMESLWNMARSNKEAMIDGQKQTLDEGRDALKERADFLTKDKYFKYKGEGIKASEDNFKTQGLSIASSLIRVEHFANAMDDGNINGAFTKYIWRPMKESASVYNERKEAITDKINSLNKKYLNKISHEDIPAPELGDGVYFKGEAPLVMALLHSGTDSSLRKLLVGKGWGSIDEQGNLNSKNWDSFVARALGDETLRKEHFDYAQEIRNLLEELKPDAQKAHKDRYGTYFDEIKSKSIETPFGTYDGGYFPAAQDRSGNNQGAIDQMIRNAKATLEPETGYSLLPGVSNGFTKARVENYNVPLSLNLNLIGDHINQVLKFTYLDPAATQVGRTFLSRDVVQSLNNLHEGLVKDVLVPFIDRAKNQTVAEKAKIPALGQAFTYLKNNSGANVMFMSVKNIILQAHGLPLAMTQVPAENMARAGLSYLTSPKETAAEIAGKSVYMKNKLNEHGFEMVKTLKDITTDKSSLEHTRDFIKSNVYFAQTAIQNNVNIITWKGAYDHSIEMDGDEQNAINKADAAVSMTQHNFAPESISSIEHSDPVLRSLMMFYSYQNMKLNLQGAEYYKALKYQGIQKGAYRAASTFALCTAIPAMLLSGLGKALSGKPWDESGDGHGWLDFLSNSGMNAVHDEFSEIPLIGQFMNSGIDQFKPGHKSIDDKVNSPITDSIFSAVHATGEIGHALQTEKWSHKTVQDSLTALSLISGVPVGFVAKPINYLNDLKSGKANPSGPIDFTRGLITGQTGK